MEERRLEVFVAVARALSFSRAATSLHLSQPAVSQQIAALEADLGCRLIERSRRSVRLTEAGELLCGRAEALLREMRELRHAVLAVQDQIAGEFVVAASLTIAEYVLPPALGRFGRLYPLARARLTVQNTEQVALSLLSGRADLGFVEGPVAAPGLILQPWREDELVVVAAPDHPWAELRAVPLEALLAEPMVLREPGSGTRQVMEEHLRAAGVDPGALRVVMELSGTEAIKATVESGLGVSVLSRSALRRELRLRSLIARPVRGLPMRRTLATVLAEGRVVLPAARALLRLAREQDGAGEAGAAPPAP